jgi:manganese/iron transport system permease protein
LTDRFSRMLVIAATTAIGSSFLGVYVSFFLNASTGACIVLLQAAVFLVALCFAPKHGLFAARRQRRLASQNL